MKIRVEEVASIIRRQIEAYEARGVVEEVGTIVEVGDGIARIHGLNNVVAGEMIEFPNGVYGLALNLEEDSVGAAILGGYLDLKEGQLVKRTGRILQVPCGRELLGRVVDPVGRPLDNKGPVHADHSRPMEIIAPGIAKRQPVKVPLQTGIKAIDAMTPIGRGQRELIIGDRRTGKTAIAVDTIINQKDTGVICVYVAIGQKDSTVAGVIAKLKQFGAMDHTIVVVAGASDPAPLQYVAPYAGCAMAEYFMYEEGRDTLCIYDDLSKHAQAYREMSLLLRRPPGREAYPGDVFYLHSRLLERAAKLVEKHVIVRKGTEPAPDSVGIDGKVYLAEPGLNEAREKLASMPDRDSLEIRRLPGSGGSLTALPIIETQEGEVSAYIPTNVISITDGQIYLLPDLFFAGVRPAIDVGISVSRVGGNAQVRAMRRVAGSLRLDLAQYRELAAFAQLGTELDAATRRQLDRGARMVELLKQPQYRPMPVEEQVMSIYAGTKGYLDDIPAGLVGAFEEGLLAHLRDRYREIGAEIVRTGDLPEEIARKLDAAIVEFKEMFVRKHGLKKGATAGT
ncbi:MAG: F0F1 ATP synthase subunit alpha [Planctomycetota bacterium]|nr:F0F1 ATP synthase subunit alpha [Planctomycetota bacterium]